MILAGVGIGNRGASINVRFGEVSEMSRRMGGEVIWVPVYTIYVSTIKLYLREPIT